MVAGGTIQKPVTTELTVVLLELENGIISIGRFIASVTSADRLLDHCASSLLTMNKSLFYM
jgi:hypothetical protein